MSGRQKTAVERLLDTAYKLQEEATDLYKRKEINRTTLRGLVDSEVVSDEEKALIMELYPIQRRPRKDKAEVEEFVLEDSSDSNERQNNE